MSTYCVWADNTACDRENLAELLPYMSDDFIEVELDCELDDVPTYDEIIRMVRNND